MAEITAEITHIRIEDTNMKQPTVSVKILDGQDYVLAKIDDLEIEIELSIALSLCTELAEQFKFGLVDLEEK